MNKSLKEIILSCDTREPELRLKIIKIIKQKLKVTLFDYQKALTEDICDSDRDFISGKIEFINELIGDEK